MKTTFIVPFLVLLVLLAVPFVAGEYGINIAVQVLLYAYLATAWNILGGYAGQHSLGHSLFLGIGAYTSTYLFTHLNITPWLGMWAGAGAAALAGSSLPIDRESVRAQDPWEHLDTFAPLPLLTLNSESDRVVPYEKQGRVFGFANTFEAAAAPVTALPTS